MYYMYIVLYIYTYSPRVTACNLSLEEGDHWGPARGLNHHINTTNAAKPRQTLQCREMFSALPRRLLHNLQWPLSANSRISLCPPFLFKYLLNYLSTYYSAMRSLAAEMVD